METYCDVFAMSCEKRGGILPVVDLLRQPLHPGAKIKRIYALGEDAARGVVENTQQKNAEAFCAPAS